MGQNRSKNPSNLLPLKSRFKFPIIKVIISCFVIALTVQSGYAQRELTFNKITTENGLSHNTVYAITQCDKGFMWFGTRDGLNRFDGKRVQVFQPGKDAGSHSSNQISALGADQKGKIHLGTTQGLLIFDKRTHTFSEVFYQNRMLGRINDIIRNQQGTSLIASQSGLYIMEDHASVQPIFQGDPVLGIAEYKKDIYWLFTSERLIMINHEGEEILSLDAISQDGTEISLSNNISSIYADSNGVFWLGTMRNGLFMLKNEKFITIDLGPGYNEIETNIIRAINEGLDNKIWVGTETGLFIYDEAANTSRRISQSFTNSPQHLNDKAIYSIFKNKEGVMWLGTYFGGVNYVKPRDFGFKVLAPSGESGHLSGKAVSQIVEDDGEVWIGTEDGGITIWNQNTNAFKYLRSSQDGSGLPVDNVHALLEDGRYMWIGTFLGGLSRYDKVTGDLKTYENKGVDEVSISSKMIYSLYKEGKERLWVGTQRGLFIFNTEKESFQSLLPDIFGEQFIYDIQQDSKGRIWVALMNSGTLYALKVENQDYSVQAFKVSPDNQNNSQGVISCFEDSNGEMWFGTSNKGLLHFNEEEERFGSYTVEDGLPNNYVYGILEDSQGRLWLSTNKGLAVLDRENYQINSFDQTYGLPNNQFNFKSYLQDDEGLMYFGTINGLCYFNPDSIDVTFSQPKVYFSDFRVFNKSVPIGEKSLLAKDIDYVEDITLKFKENVVTFEFGSVDFFSNGRDHFAYFLEGFDKDWTFVKNTNTATYTNLAPGDYRFRVKYASDFITIEEERVIDITVLRPWWISNIALVIYLSIIIAIILLYRRFLKVREAEKLQVQVERMEKEKIEEINRHKINFFTYISHEFKTPLTLIMASVDQLIYAGNSDTKSNTFFNSIKKNTKRLHVLIDQLMEFRRVEADHANLNLNEGDIILFLQDTFEAFIPWFSKKQLSHHFNADPTSYTTYFDSDKIEKIITNILSNAIKHTESHGAIEMDVLIEASGNNIEIIISDTGSGINPKDMEKVFNQFYKISEEEGTGLGLALVKSLVNFLGGKISVNSNLQRGTFVSIYLPLITEKPTEEYPKIVGNKKMMMDADLVFGMEDGEEKGAQSRNLDKGVQEVLLVEDNDEMRALLKSFFRSRYRVSVAENGKKGMALIKKNKPDLVISDIMMPQMDGMELCKAIKQDLDTSHIPVILLTAKSEFETKLESLNLGADAFISKPFDIREIDLVVNNILDTRRNLKQHFLKFGNLNDVKIPINNRDQDFLEKLRKIVENHLEDSDFNISTFTKEAGVSRTLLHTKIKKLVGMSATEFVKTIRLNHAAKLLKEQDITVSEVAYKVGYADSNYFSRSFKAHFNVSPTEYKEQPLE